MIYQYDQALQLPTVDLYDTLLMAMALNAAKDMYDRGELQIKDFLKAYGDFLTPITADLDWWNLNVTGRVRDAINQMYARGGDPLRNALDRALLSMLINNMPYGDMAKLKTSAENAKQYLNERAKLEAAGLYNPLFAKYEGYDTNTYNTLDNGIWDKMSPTKITDMATFGNPYFEGMKPNVHRESKNGVDYTIESITEDDLKNIADAHFNELVSTPQGQLMFKYYRDLAGGDSNPKANEEARRMFNEAIVDGQRRRIYMKDDYDDQWAKRELLKQGLEKIRQDAAELLLKRDEFNWEKSYYDRVLNGEGGGVSADIPTMGAADQVALDQKKQYNSVQENYYKQLDQKEQSSYKKLSKGEQVLAKKYRKSIEDINNSSTNEERRKLAKDFVAKWDTNGSENFKQWTNDYYKSVNKDLSWAKYSSSTGEDTEWGTLQNQITLLNKAHEAFLRQNILLNAIDSGIQVDMNHSLSLTEDEDGNHVGNVGKETDFAPIIEAAMTGNRFYKYNSSINKINRAIKGKPYKITLQDQISRKYGNGSIKSANYDVIQQKATFTDPSVIEELNKYSEQELNDMGIDVVKNEDTVLAYKIPIISKFSRGSQTWANVNTETDKRIGGVSEATKRRATRQASSIMNRIQ